MNFAANCVLNGSPGPIPCAAKKAPIVEKMSGDVSGMDGNPTGARFMWLNTLNISTRNWRGDSFGELRVLQYRKVDF